MKLNTYVNILFCLFIIACKTPRPDISDEMPLHLTKVILEKDPYWSLHIATINTFTIPVVPPFRQERISLIGDRIDHYQFDYVSIQEAFSNSVRSKLYDRSLMPYTKYFDVKGTIGSGMVMLSKYPLDRQTFWYHLLMGRAHNAEFWSGKGVAKATIVKSGLPVSLYNVHLLSRLSKNADENVDYNSVDRLSELFEVFTQIVEQRDSDAFAVLGDFNMNVNNKEFTFFKNLTQLEGTLFQESDQSLCTYCGSNSFVKKGEGQLDYIWISPRLEFLEKEIFLKKTYVISGKPSNLSDHYGVRALVGIKSNQLSFDVKTNRFEQTLEQVRYLNSIVSKELDGDDPFKEESKGASEHLCRTCRLKDVLKISNNYIKALDRGLEFHELSETQVQLRKRLESYFSLF